MDVVPSSSSLFNDSVIIILRLRFPCCLCCVLILFLAAAISFDNFLIIPFVIAYSGFSGSVSPLGPWFRMRLSAAAVINCCSAYVSSIYGFSLCAVGGMMII